MGRTKALVAIVWPVCFVVQSDARAHVQPVPEGEANFRIVPGLRHGPSYIRRNFLVATTPLQKGVLDFKHYHK